jgi:hypothetical protein
VKNAIALVIFMTVAEEKKLSTLIKNHLAWSTASIVRNGISKGLDGTSIVRHTSRSLLPKGVHR